MKLKHLRLAVIAISLQLFTVNFALSQCTVEINSASVNILCGDCVTLSAYGEGQGFVVFEENFNSGSFGPGWSASQQAMWNSPCGPGPAGSTHVWLGNSSPVPRILQTQSYNLSTAVAGVTIKFDMKFATQGDNAPCEGPDEPDEGVHLQYSINGGSSWVDIHYFDPNGGNDPQLINWNSWSFPLPAVAVTSNTIIRWFQDNDSGADYDHWGIDNVKIFFNDPSYQITLPHDGYNLGSTGGVDPTPVCPHTTTTYTVTMTNGTYTCTGEVTVNVVPPTVDASILPGDTTICLGQSIDLNGTNHIVKSPAKTPTYSNDEITALQTSFGAVTSININITDLNMTTVLTNSITKVCIHNLTYAGFGSTLSDLEISLENPDATKIILVPNGLTTGASGYTNTCFIPSGDNITTSASPYTGNWLPSEPFDNMVGHASNGVWKMNIKCAVAASIGFGTFTGWDISFDDPELSTQGLYTWSPTTYLNNATSLNPTVNNPPVGTYIYTLSVTDPAGCASGSETITVTVENCCSFNFSGNVTNTVCNYSNGGVDLSVTPSGNYSYAWSNGVSTQDLANVPAGHYTVTISDLNQAGCQQTTSFDIVNNGLGPVLSGSVSSEICGNGDGSINLSVGTGSGNNTYNWSNGSSSEDIDNLPSGTYTVSVTDNTTTCTASQSFTVTNTINNPQGYTESSPSKYATPTGTATVIITVAGGVLPLNYQWSNGISGNDSSSIHNVQPGIYTCTVTNTNTGCSSVFNVIVDVIRDDLITSNVFTPNNDGKNDVFKIEFIEEYENTQVLIYDRWGGKVFESSNYDNNFNAWTGSNCSDGVYYYIINTTVGNKKQFNGSVTLIR